MSVFRTSLLVVLLSAGCGLVRAQTLPTSPTLIGTPANLTLPIGSSAPPVNLTQMFDLPGVTGQIVQMKTNLGPINIELEPQAAPQTVTNFLSYVNSGAYTDTIFFRTVSALSGGLGVIQGGGYTVSSGSTSPTVIPASAPVPLEFNASYPDARGTIAMARTSVANSATDEWFINDADNTYTLGSGNDGGYAVFGRVLGAGMAVVDAIDALPTTQVGADTTDFAAVPIYNDAAFLAGTFTYSNWVLVSSVAVIPMYPSATGGVSVLTFTATSSNPAAVTASVSGGTTLTMTGVAPGEAAVTVSAIDSNGGSASAVYNVTVAPNFAIVQQPAAETVETGSTAVLSVAASPSASTTYQWLLNGSPISSTVDSSATSSHLVISPATAANNGSYSCVVTNSGTALTSESAQLTVVSTASVGRLTNLSVLTSDITATQSLTLGYVVGSGTPNLPLLLRASGPALTAFSITNYIPDPTIALYNDANNPPSLLASEQGWSSTSANQNAVTAAQAATGAFPFAVGSADSAMVQSLAPGNYSLIIKSVTGKSGSTLGEVFDASTGFTASNSQLINLSSQLAVGPGHSLTAGFTISGTTAKTVLIRGVGPTLGSFGLTGLMPDPQLTLFGSASVQLAANTGWAGDSQIAAEAALVHAFTLPASSADSAILITLPPGGYSAQVTSASGAGGNALVEVYEVP
jgi:cyclophilin family peptidyl-prolyl cis-trans isomerase